MLYNARVESVFISNVESVPNSNVESTCIVKIEFSIYNLANRCCNLFVILLDFAIIITLYKYFNFACTYSIAYSKAIIKHY